MYASFDMKNEYLTMIKGDTLAFNMEIENMTNPLASAYFSCRKNYDDVNYAFQKTLSNGITLLSHTNGVGLYLVKVAPEDTETLEAGQYHYDLQIGIGDDIYTVIKGVLELDEDVTK